MAQEPISTPEALLNHNTRRQIDNPLRHRDKSELPQIGKAFAYLVDKACPPPCKRPVHENDVCPRHGRAACPQVKMLECPRHGKEECPEDANRISPNQAMFITAAKIAYDSPGWRKVCNAEEAYTLEKSKNASTFWRQTRALQTTVVALCLSAVIQGFCQSVLNGANQTLPEAFGLANEDDPKSVWIFAGLNAIVYLTAGFFACLVSDPLQWRYLGRRGAILVAACLCLASVIGGAFTSNWQQLMVCRALLGIGLGAKASITPLFCAEVSPSHLRGALTVNWQLFDAVGIFLGFSANLALSSTGHLSWRFQTASACIPTVCLITIIWTVPESPRWLLKQGKYAQAFSSMCALRHSPLEAAAELIYANEQVQLEVALLPSDFKGVDKIAAEPSSSRFQSAVMNTDYWLRILQLFRNEGTRRATVAAAVVMIGQQLCGINVLAFYSTTFFRDMNDVSSRNALWKSWGVGLANFTFAILAYFWIDTRGRRYLLLATYPGMILSMFAACVSFLRNDDGVISGLVYAFLFVFVLFYSVGQGPVAFAYSSEVFPLLYREAGMSFSVFVNLTGAGILTLLVPQAQNPKSGDFTSGHEWKLKQIRLLGAFTAFNVLSFVMIFFLVPETAGATVSKKEGKLNYMSLEELKYIFGVPTSKQIKENLKAVGIAWQIFKFRMSQILYTYNAADGNIDRERGSEPGTVASGTMQGTDQRPVQTLPRFLPRYDWEVEGQNDLTDGDEDSIAMVQQGLPAAGEISNAVASSSSQPYPPEDSATSGRDAKVVELLEEAISLVKRKPHHT